MMRSVRRWILISFLSSGLFVAQIALAPLPNVQIVSLLFIIYAFILPLPTLVLVSVLFSLLQMLFWGMGDWVVGYLWIWPVWVMLIYIFKRYNDDNAQRWALLNAVWGIIFGFLFAVHHGFLYGFQTLLIYYLRGISFDIIHTVSNYILTFFMFTPLYKVINKLAFKYQGDFHESNDKNR